MIKNLFGLMLIVFGIGFVNISAQTESDVKTITKSVVNGLATSLPKPDYPSAAKAVGASGAVNVQVLIDENGNVIKAVAVSGHPLLRGASEKAAQSSTFNPAKLNGEAVRVRGVIVYNFVPSSPPDANTEAPVGRSNDDVPVMAANGSKGFTSGNGKPIVNDAAVNLPRPAYPPAARAVKASGAVNVQVLIDESGNVVKAEAISGHPLLRAAAVEAALGAKFKPTLLEGNPVKVNGIVVYNFVP